MHTGFVFRHLTKVLCIHMCKEMNEQRSDTNCVSNDSDPIQVTKRLSFQRNSQKFIDDTHLRINSTE